MLTVQNIYFSFLRVCLFVAYCFIFLVCVCMILIFFFLISVKEKRKSLSRARLFVTPWTIQSMEFSKQEYWSG